MKKSLLGAIAITLLYSNCSDVSTSEQLLDDNNAPLPMTFSVSQEPISRAVNFLESADNLEQFYLVAQLQGEVYTHQFFNRDGDDFFASDEEVLWPYDSREQVTFYAVNFNTNDRNYLYYAIQQDNDVVPLNNHSIEIPVDDSFYHDLVAAHYVTSANQTTNGIVPLVFKHMLAEVEVYVKADSPGMNYLIYEVSFLSEDNTRIYNFENNSWSTGSSDQKIREILYFPSNDYATNGFSVTETDNYIEIINPGFLPGNSFRFMLPGEYTLQITYRVPSANDPVIKNCKVILEQNKINKINLTLTPPNAN